MGLFGSGPINCSVCGKDTTAKENKKHKISGGAICHECFLSAGYVSKQVCFADTVESIKLKIGSRQGVQQELKQYTFNVKIDGLWIDLINRKWVFKFWKYAPLALLPTESEDFSEVYSFDEVLDVSLDLDEESVGQVKIGGIGRAIVGGLVFGGVGAIVGAQTGGSKITYKETLKQAELKLYLEGNPTRIIHMPLYFIKEKKRKTMYGGKLESGELMLLEFKKMIESASSETIISEVVSPSNVSEEIRKYKSLLDDGIITQEEFDQKKKQLLDL
jgi:hypothetical protein